MNRLNRILIKTVRWTSWPLLLVIVAFLVTGYAMTGEWGCDRLLDATTAIGLHRLLHVPLMVLTLAHCLPASYLALQRWGWIKQRT